MKMFVYKKKLIQRITKKLCKILNKKNNKLEKINHEKTELQNNFNENVTTDNIAHCFSKYILFDEWLKGIENIDKITIQSKSFEDFLTCKSSSKNCDRFAHLPLPVHLVIKHNNMGKIDTHRWFFKGFCNLIKPEFIQLIDCGSIPLQNSISYIIERMEDSPNLGGACGEIECLTSDIYGDYEEIKDDKKKGWKSKVKSLLTDMIVCTQYIEYKIAHYLDKSAESAFGFVSVLPGAFSAFRWEAIQRKPLRKFLKGAKNDLNPYDIMKCYKANMYLAEDRIMCLEIIANIVKLKDPKDENKEIK